MARLVVIWLPRIELIVGLLLIIGVAARLVAAFSTLLIIGFIYSNSWLLAHGLGLEPCDCFGFNEALMQVELTVRSSLYIDAGMLALVLLILFYYPGKFIQFHPWYFKSKIADSPTDKEVS